MAGRDPDKQQKGKWGAMLALVYFGGFTRHDVLEMTDVEANFHLEELDKYKKAGNGPKGT